MKLCIERRWKRQGYTIGILYIDGVRFCETLEDRDRGLRQDMTVAAIRLRKVFGRTAIPTGIYHVDISTVSPKFRNRTWAIQYGGVVPRLLDVKGFDGVLIHPGNTAADTNGCVLVGDNKEVGKVLNSTATFHRLFARMIDAAGDGEDITIEIR